MLPTPVWEIKVRRGTKPQAASIDYRFFLHMKGRKASSMNGIFMSYFLVYENKVNEPDCISNFSKRKVFQDNLLKEIKYSHCMRYIAIPVGI